MKLAKNLQKTMSKKVVALTSAALLISSGVAAAESVTWRLQTHIPTGSGSWEDSVVAMAEKIEERTDGRLKIELHSAGALMGATEIFPAVKRGIIQMGYTSPAYLMEYIPTAGLAFAVPGAFQETWEATHFWKNLGFEDLVREEAAEHGILYFTEKLYPTEMVLKEPVESLEDFSSLKVRSAGLLQTFLTEVGAAATYIPGPEIYQALSTGVVDGAHWGAVQEANALSLYETAKYHVKPALGIGGVEAWIINEDAMNKLPGDVQEIVKTTIEEHFWKRTTEYQYQELATLKKLEETQGVELIELPQAVQDRMWEVGQEIRNEQAEKSENAAEAVRRLDEFLESLDRI
jgi:TRAP-type C4-dicarboxylate transport system substrate-binding protein